MAKGRKTGGRQPGTPNRRTVEVLQRLTALGCDPIEGMARLAMDQQNPPELRGRMFAELAQYVAPKRKALEVEPTERQPVRFNINLGVPRRPAATAPHPVTGNAEPTGL